MMLRGDAELSRVSPYLRRSSVQYCLSGKRRRARIRAALHQKGWRITEADMTKDVAWMERLPDQSTEELEDCGRHRAVALALDNRVLHVREATRTCRTVGPLPLFNEPRTIG